MVIDRLLDRGESHIQQWQVLRCLAVEEDFNFLSFRIGNDLPCYEDVVWRVEDVQAHVVDEVGKVDLFIGRESEGGDVLGFLSRDAF